LCALLTTGEVTRFMAPPPMTVDGFVRFIDWAHQQRAAGTYTCFAVVPDGLDAAVGLFQIRIIGDRPSAAEWGFALGSAHWGTGLFQDSARSLLTFAFDEVGVGRLEARCAVQNGRANGALRKVGALQEAVLRGAGCRLGQHLDQALWTILRADWREGTAVRSATLH
jgi:RimJ/RimL family protein N-acetyltransferase